MDTIARSRIFDVDEELSDTTMHQRNPLKVVEICMVHDLDRIQFESPSLWRKSQTREGTTILASRIEPSQ